MVWRGEIRGVGGWESMGREAGDVGGVGGGMSGMWGDWEEEGCGRGFWWDVAVVEEGIGWDGMG